MTCVTCLQLQVFPAGCDGDIFSWPLPSEGDYFQCLLRTTSELIHCSAWQWITCAVFLTKVLPRKPSPSHLEYHLLSVCVECPPVGHITFDIYIWSIAKKQRNVVNNKMHIKDIMVWPLLKCRQVTQKAHLKTDIKRSSVVGSCLLYTSDAADE